MKVTRVEFTWQVPFVDKNGKWDHRRIFEARDFDIRWLPKRGVLLIDGRPVHPAQAAWEVEGCAACEAPEGHASGCPLDSTPGTCSHGVSLRQPCWLCAPPDQAEAAMNRLQEQADGAADPGAPGAPAGRKGARKKG